jgi:hypothetical protein
VELRAGVALAAEARRLLARLRLVVGEHVGRVKPLGVVVQQTALLVQAVRAETVLVARLLHLPLLTAVVHRRAQVVGSVREGAVRAVLDAVAAVVGVVDAHPGLVIS